MPFRRTYRKARKVLRKKAPIRRKAPVRARPRVRRAFGTRYKKASSKIAIARSNAVGAGQTALNSYPNMRPIPHSFWFKNLLKNNTPAEFAGNYSGRVACAQNVKQSFTFWLNKSTVDIQGLLNYWGPDSVVSRENNAMKFHMFDLVKEHEWRSTTNATTGLELYVLWPRRRLATSTTDTFGVSTTLPQISPLSQTGLYTNAYLAQPSMYTQDFLDRDQSGTAGKIAYNSIMATPYMSPTLCANFKIKPLSIMWPNGQRGHKGYLEAGQTLRLTSASRKVVMYNYNKLGLTGQAYFNVGRTWEVLEDTPLLFVYVTGTPSHSAEAHQEIALGYGALDYVARTKFKGIMSNVVRPTTGFVTTDIPNLTTPEQMVPATATLESELP